MITYLKTGLDETVIRLLQKLENTGYVAGLVKAFENQAYSIRKVFNDEILVGIILFKGVNLTNGKCALEVIHVIAAENDSKFCDILGESIEAFAVSQKIFDVLHFHANKENIIRLMKKYFDSPQECIYKKELVLSRVI